MYIILSFFFFFPVKYIEISKIFFFSFFDRQKEKTIFTKWKSTAKTFFFFFKSQKNVINLMSAHYGPNGNMDRY